MPRKPSKSSSKPDQPALPTFTRDVLREQSQRILEANWQHLTVNLPTIIQTGGKHLEKIDRLLESRSDPADLAQLMTARSRVVESLNQSHEQQVIQLSLLTKPLLQIVEMIEAPPKETVSKDTEAEALDTADLSPDQVETLRRLGILPDEPLTDSDS